MKVEDALREVFKEHEEILLAYLYGSLAKGTETEKSDLDIGLLLKEDFELYSLYTSNLSGEIEEKVGSKRK